MSSKTCFRVLGHFVGELRGSVIVLSVPTMCSTGQPPSCRAQRRYHSGQLNSHCELQGSRTLGVLLCSALGDVRPAAIAEEWRLVWRACDLLLPRSLCWLMQSFSRLSVALWLFVCQVCCCCRLGQTRCSTCAASAAAHSACPSGNSFRPPCWARVSSR